MQNIVRFLQFGFDYFDQLFNNFFYYAISYNLITWFLFTPIIVGFIFLAIEFFIDVSQIQYDKSPNRYHNLKFNHFKNNYYKYKNKKDKLNFETYYDHNISRAKHIKEFKNLANLDKEEKIKSVAQRLEGIPFEYRYSVAQSLFNRQVHKYANGITRPDRSDYRDNHNRSNSALDIDYEDAPASADVSEERSSNG